jgi:RND family efflux transporter MFP subunit
MKTLLRILLPIAVLVAGAAVLKWQILSRPVLADQEPRSYVPLVEVLPLIPETVRLQVEANGVVEAEDPLPLAPEVGGRVVGIAEDLVEGGRVAAGEVLFRIDPADAGTSLAAAEAALEGARAALELEEAAAAAAVADWNELGDGEPGALVRREPQLAAARAELAAREAARDRAARDLARCAVRAPFDARVQAVDLALGQILAPGVPVARLLPADTAWLRLPLPLHELGHLGIQPGATGLGAPVQVSAEMGGGTVRREGRLERLRPDLDPASRMLHGLVRIEQPFGTDGLPALPPGVFARAVLAGRSVDGLFRVPRLAMREGDVVHLADDEDRLVIRPVRVLQWTADAALVEEGLAAGERLVLTALPVAAAGMQLEVREAGR